MFFDDGQRKIDFILTYTIADKERDEKHADDRDKRKKKRETFLAKFKDYGLEYEIQDASVSDSYKIIVNLTSTCTVFYGLETISLGVALLMCHLPYKE